MKTFIIQEKFVGYADVHIDAETEEEETDSQGEEISAITEELKPARFWQTVNEVEGNILLRKRSFDRRPHLICSIGDRIDVIYKIQRDTYNSDYGIVLIIDDLKPTWH